MVLLLGLSSCLHGPVGRVATLSGIVHGPGAGGSVLALTKRQDAVAGAASIGPDGRWSMQLSAPARWVVVRLTQERIAAVLVPVERSAQIDLPPLFPIELHVEGDLSVGVMMNPAHLEGFPDKLQWVLRWQSEKVELLSVYQHTVVEPGSFRILVQKGRYRVGGGASSLPSRGSHVRGMGVVLCDHLVVESTDQVLPCRDGSVTMQVDRGLRARVVFRRQID